MTRVIIESPYAAPTPEGIAYNVSYARACLRDSLLCYEWVKKNREAYRERRREKYYADKGLPVPGPSNHRRVKLS